MLVQTVTQLRDSVADNRSWYGGNTGKQTDKSMLSDVSFAFPQGSDLYIPLLNPTIV